MVEVAQQNENLEQLKKQEFYAKQAEAEQRKAEIEAEKQKMRKKVDKILAHKPDVFINRQLIYNYPEQLLAEKGVMVIEHADFEGIERLAVATGSEIISTFD